MHSNGSLRLLGAELEKPYFKCKEIAGQNVKWCSQTPGTDSGVPASDTQATASSSVTRELPQVSALGRLSTLFYHLVGSPVFSLLWLTQLF